MWYKSASAFWYIDDQDIVWRCWPDGAVVQTRQDADATANLAERIDMPEWGSRILRTLDPANVAAILAS